MLSSNFLLGLPSSPRGLSKEMLYAFLVLHPSYMFNSASSPTFHDVHNTMKQSPP